MTYIELTVKDHQILHGFDQNNKEIIEKVAADQPVKKLINVDRILSISEQFVLTSYAYGRIIYWEYLDDYAQVKKMLSSQGLMTG